MENITSIFFPIWTLRGQCGPGLRPIFGPTNKKNVLLGPKAQFLALKREILGSLGQKRPAEGPNGVLPVIQSYPEIAGDMVLTF